MNNDSTANIVVEDTNENHQNIFNQKLKIIIGVLIGVFVLSFTVTILSLWILHDNPTNGGVGIKNHKNYKKFKKETCTINSTKDFRRDINNMKFPWLVKILRDNGTESVHFCTGFLISNDVILTAAHCIYEDEDSEVSAVHIGGTFEKNFDDVIKISRKYLRLILHPGFKPYELKDFADIGLIKLPTPLSLSNELYPICLPIEDREIPETPENLAMTMWVDRKLENMNIQKSAIAVMDSDKCAKNFAKFNDTLYFYRGNGSDKKKIIFCVAYKDVDINVGDSGAPAISIDENSSTAYGILSLGGTEENPMPNVFVDIRAHLQWILDNA